MMAVCLMRFCVFILTLAAFPAAAWAQSGIAGKVTDTTGGVLPGVTVEARSPALIEQLRTAVTDESGQYLITDLRPGVYSVAFVLTGFGTVIRDNITLESAFTATVDMQMRVSSVEETITVSGQAPVVDVQSVQRRQVMSKDQVDALPTGRSYMMIGATIPALNTTDIDVGGTAGMQQGRVGAYGENGVNASFSIDGVKIDSSRAGETTAMNLTPNSGAVEEWVFQLNGGNAESQSGGVQIQMIPRTGSNQFHGDVLANWSGQQLTSNNASPDQLTRGLEAPPKVQRLNDVNPSVGGPIRQDRLWFFASVRRWEVDELSPIAHDGRYGPPGEPVLDDSDKRDVTARMTWQLSSQNKLSASYSLQPKYRRWYGIDAANRRPEATYTFDAKRNHMAVAKWTGTFTNRLLLEAGFNWNTLEWPNKLQPGVRTPEEFPPYGDVGKEDLVYSPSFYNSPQTLFRELTDRFNTMASLSYVTGAHAVKFGFQVSNSLVRVNRWSNGDLLQRYRAGVPFGVVVYQTPIFARSESDEFSVFAQDSWKRNRLTLNYGLRYDRYVGSVPQQNQPGGRFLPARSFPAISNIPKWTDVSPRVGATYDLFGDSRTALKFSWGKFPLSAAVAPPARYNPMDAGIGGTSGGSDARNWTDLNGNDIAEDNEIGPSRNPGFGTRVSSRPGPDLGRGYDFLYNLSLDHELWAGVGMSVSYNRREFRNLQWTDNLAYDPEDYQLLGILDPRGTGQMLPIYQLLPASIAPTNDVDKNSDANRRTYNGMDLLMNARLGRGAFFSLGTSTGRVISRICEVESPNALRFCDQSQFDIPFLTNFKASGAFPLPWMGLQVGGVFQSNPGREKSVTYSVTRAQLPALTTASSVSVRLTEPGSVYYSRLNQLDLSLSGRIAAGRIRMKPQIDFFNALNVNTVLSESTVYPGDGVIRTILPGRIIRVGIQMNF